MEVVKEGYMGDFGGGSKWYGGSDSWRCFIFGVACAAIQAIGLWRCKRKEMQRPISNRGYLNSRLQRDP